MDKAYENLSIAKDIMEINDLLNKYSQYGYIDREKAISKIRELRSKNDDICKFALTAITVNRVPFDQASSNQIANELDAYRAILMDKYMRNAQEENHADA